MEGLRDFDVAGQIETIAVPTLVIIGDHDRVLPPDQGCEVARCIPNAQLVSMEDSGHLSYAEQPADFNSAVLSFLESI